MHQLHQKTKGYMLEFTVKLHNLTCHMTNSKKKAVKKNIPSSLQLSFTLIKNQLVF